MAFVPNPIPRELKWDQSLVVALTEAQTALGRLSGLGADFPKPDRLIRMFLRREAEYSSRIERTYAGVRTLLLFDVVPEVAIGAPDVREVENNYQLLLFAFEASRRQSLSLSLLRQMHQFLFKNVEHPPKVVGDFRRVQNWIGTDNNIANARYVPPPPTRVVDCLDDLVNFVRSPPSLPLLARTAMLHYQFEAIHPFDDGNGRIGRALVLWQLVAGDGMELPLLNPSAPLEARRREYYDLLLDVSTHGRWNAWIEYFCRCVSEECVRSIEVVKQLTQLRQRFQNAIRDARMAAIISRLVDHLFGDPAITVKSAAELLQISPQSAQRAIENLMRLNLISEVTKQKRNRVFMAEDIVALFSRDKEFRS